MTVELERPHQITGKCYITQHKMRRKFPYLYMPPAPSPAPCPGWHNHWSGGSPSGCKGEGVACTTSRQLWWLGHCGHWLTPLPLSQHSTHWRYNKGKCFEQQVLHQKTSYCILEEYSNPYPPKKADAASQVKRILDEIIHFKGTNSTTTKKLN